MRGRRVAAYAVSMILTTVIGWSSASPAVAADPISYSGRAVAGTATVSGQTTVLADTGELPSTGGSLEASSETGLAAIIAGDTLHASTIGQGDRTRSEASMGSFIVTTGLITIAADLAMSRSMARKHGSVVELSATSHVNGLTLNGVPVVVTGQPNQSVPLPGGQLIVNEQTTSTGGAMKSITVNAIHLTVGSSEAVLGTSRAGATIGAASCSSSADFATGGGWIQLPLEAKKTFGFMGGVKANGSIHGHVVFFNHEANERLKGTVTGYPGGSGTTRTMTGTGDADGEAATFELTVTDNGEPGTADDFTLAYSTITRNRLENGTLGGGNIQVHDICS